MMELKREHWATEDYREFGNTLASQAEDKFREFVLTGIVTERPLLGVRTPRLRAMAKEIAKGNYAEFLRHEPVSYEEVAVRGYVIALLPEPELMRYFWEYLSLIDNWGVCDTFVASLKLVKQDKSKFLEVVQELISRERGEFEVRTGLVMLLDYYVGPGYLQVIFECIDKVRTREEYYIRMAVAWLLCECYVKFPDETYSYMKQGKIPDWTLKKAVNKICDSYRVPAEGKELARGIIKR